MYHEGTSYSSALGSFLCFGFLRAVFGTIGREAFTVPTRSRAIARTSFLASKRFVIPFEVGFIKCPLCYTTVRGRPSMLRNIGPTELIVILLVFLLLFGGKKLADVGKGLGEGIRNFKSSLKGDDPPPPSAPEEKKEETKQA